MNLKEKIESVASENKKWSNYANQTSAELERLNKCIQPTNEQLYKNVHEFADIEIKKKDYMFILGGDGRSRPWDEQRNGIVATIKAKNGVYLSNNQFHIIKDFVINTNKVDHVEMDIK